MFLVLFLNALTLLLCPALALLWNGASCDAGIQIISRSGVYYAHNNETGQQESLRTSDKGEARRLLSAKNESACMGNLNLQIARAYMVAVDPEMPKRTWREVIRFMIEDNIGHGWPRSLSAIYWRRLPLPIGGRVGSFSTMAGWWRSRRSP